MATVATQLNAGSGFASGEVVTATKLNSLVNTATVTGIVNADIDAAAGIAASKLALSGAITATELATGAVTGAAGGGKLAASAITGQTTIADALADTDEFLVHDASASALRKVSYSNIAPTVTASKLDGVAKDGSGNNLSAGSAPIFGCRAWVNFNGNSVTNVGGEDRCAINSSGNVTKVVRLGTGDYVVHFTTAMSNANYCVVALTSAVTGGASYAYLVNANTTTTTRIQSWTVAGGNFANNSNPTCVAVFGT